MSATSEELIERRLAVALRERAKRIEAEQA